MDDILSTLRFCANLHPQAGYPENGKIFGQAADEIERLRAELAALKHDPTCAKCGHPRSNHPYRHPFVAMTQKGGQG